MSALTIRVEDENGLLGVFTADDVKRERDANTRAVISTSVRVSASGRHQYLGNAKLVIGGRSYQANLMFTEIRPSS